MIKIDNVLVTIMDLPTTVKAFTKYDGLGFYNIYINARINPEQQQMVYLHELRHVINDDFYKDDVDNLEAINHKEDNHGKGKI